MPSVWYTMRFSDITHVQEYTASQVGEKHRPRGSPAVEINAGDGHPAGCGAQKMQQVGRVRVARLALKAQILAPGLSLGRISRRFLNREFRSGVGD